MAARKRSVLQGTTAHCVHAWQLKTWHQQGKQNTVNSERAAVCCVSRKQTCRTAGREKAIWAQVRLEGSLCFAGFSLDVPMRGPS